MVFSEPIIFNWINESSDFLFYSRLVLFASVSFSRLPFLTDHTTHSALIITDSLEHDSLLHSNKKAENDEHWRHNDFFPHLTIYRNYSSLHTALCGTFRLSPARSWCAQLSTATSRDDDPAFIWKFRVQLQNFIRGGWQRAMIKFHWHLSELSNEISCSSPSLFCHSLFRSLFPFFSLSPK